MGLLAIATLPARAAIAGAEPIIATLEGRVALQPTLRPNADSVVTRENVAGTLNEVLEPLTRPAERLPGRGRRAS